MRPAQALAVTPIEAPKPMLAAGKMVIACALPMMLLAIIVNLCLRAVGLLLINTLLIVPAATAANLSRNLRQMFWLTIALCIGCCLAGQALNWELLAWSNLRINLDIAGTVVLLAVGLFFLSLLVGPILRNRKTLYPGAGRAEQA